jgi:hypothetical protein
MYILPIYRFTVYAMGIILGYLLRKHVNIKLSNSQLILGWIVTTTLFILTLAASSMMSVYDYSFSSVDAGLFSSIAPIPFCLFFAWMIYTAHLGYKSRHFYYFLKFFFNLLLFSDAFTRFFEWRGFLISTKLSYGIYLVQFAVFHYNISKVRNSKHFGIIKSVVSDDKLRQFSENKLLKFQANTNEILWIIFASALMTLFFDLPFGNLKKLIFDSKKKTTVVMEKKELNVDVNANEIVEQKKVK